MQNLESVAQKMSELGRVYGSRQIEFSRPQRLEFYLPTLTALSVHLINNLVIGLFFYFFLGLFIFE